MASDYDSIREENIRGYGEHKHHLALLGRLYADRTHFIFELLQNAEDAGATRVGFELFRDRLEFRHDGRPFNEADVRAICGVGQGTKSDDLTKIGKFGIGFKAVYAYTDSPEIHSGEEHFRIESYVRPFAVSREPLDRGCTTAFRFPFDRPDVNPEQAYTEIGNALRMLSERTLLFLRNINRLTWSCEAGDRGEHSRGVKTNDIGRWVAIVRRENEELIGQEGWLVFDRSIDRQNARDTAEVRVEIAFHIDSSSGDEVIVPFPNAELVVFFPTAKETRLGFLIHGSYRTTPARDNIPSDDEWNRFLVEETAALVTETLPRLRDNGLIGVGLLESLPTRASDFPTSEMFYPLYLAVRETLKTEPLLPTHDGGHVSARDAKLARGAGLADLFSPRQLGALFGREESLHWLTADISEDRSPNIRRYLMQNRALWYQGIQIPDGLSDEIEVRPETIARNLTAAFMAKQSDDWVGRFYAFLGGQRAIWQSLKNRPFVRLEDGTHTAPFRLDGSPGAFLPSGNLPGFPTVSRAVIQSEQALDFLTQFGLREPDTIAEVIEQVLPKYQPAGDSRISDDEHTRHLQLLIRALGTDSIAHKTELLDRIEQTPFFRAVNSASGAVRFAALGEIYEGTPDLKEYFAANPDIWFIEEPLLTSAQMRDLKVGNGVSIDRREPNGASGHVTLRDGWGDHARGLDGFDPDARIDGLEHALQKITRQKAAYIWNRILVPEARSLRGIVETSSRQSFQDSDREECISAAAQLLVDAPWLPSRSGEFRFPADLSLDDLPEEFLQDDHVARALGMRPAVLAKFAEHYDVDPDDLRFIRQNKAEFKTWLRSMRDQRRTPPTEEGSSADAGDGFVEALRAAFARPASDDLPEVRPTPDPIGNVVIRRERVRQDIHAARINEPDQYERFWRVPAKVWEAKNGQARQFLTEEYSGRCQICGDGFDKHDGVPYFEGMYLVSRINARWLDRPGSMLCLCATCCAKFLHGTVEVDEDVLQQILGLRTAQEGGQGERALRIRLCDRPTQIRYTERHLIDLQEIVREAMQPRDPVHAS